LTLGDDRDPERDSEADNAQQLLILAYARLFLLPERPDGSKLTTVASFGSYHVRLVELPSRDKIHPLWIELFDGRAGRIVDSLGFCDLHDGAENVEAFMAEAARPSGITPRGVNSQ
jgi:hypothetical protein